MSLPKLKAEEGEIFKFINPDDRIHAKFLGRRNVKTKNQDNASVLDCEIIESNVVDARGREEEGPIGLHSIFESTHVRQLMDQAMLKPGDEFFLQFCSVDKASKFKKFALRRADAELSGEPELLSKSEDDADDVPSFFEPKSEKKKR
jgi:hypothetical protein